MSKNYQRRENYNAQDTSVESVAPEAAQEALTQSDEAAASYATVTTDTADSTPTPVYTPVSSSAFRPPAFSPPVITPVAPQPKKAPMLPVQSELTALAQAIDPKQPVLPRWQYTLFQLLKSVIENEDNAEFFQQWTAVLSFYHSSKGTAFSDMYMLRFSDEWPGSDSEFALFRRLISIVSQTSDPQERRKMSTMINFSRATEGLQEDARNRLIGFYS